ncbi:uncharacterized protein LOC110809126, partial [Carica papaya]|uniref:uncharacterized protein LOC110809126 n=1 Tax=Carica papaya TaxID=3649 RepID=UPI000B8C75D8
MSSKVDEPRNSKTSSTVSTIGPKISMFAAKSGFVIPKNKLSGSLVPVLRGVKKSGGSDAANDESTNQVQRKTKWGPDLTHDAAVRRGRALAYQTRVDQIAKQLKSGTLDAAADQHSLSDVQDENDTSLYSQLDNEKLNLLELERREIIGMI